jgi:hypothetical protein
MSTSEISPPPSAEETGKLLAEYGTGSFLHKALLVCLPLPVALFLGPWVYMAVHALLQGGMLFTNPGFIACTVILLGFGGFFLVGWLLAWAARRWRLLLFENGLHFAKSRSARWIPWRDVDRYTEINVVMNGVSTGHRLYLYPRQGKKIAIEGVFKDAPAVAQHIKACLVPALTRQAQERLARHEAVDFKFVQLSHHGLQTRKDFVAWKDLESVAVEDNKGLGYVLRVRVPGQKKPWLSVPVTSFPNLDMFLQLVEQQPGR